MGSLRACLQDEELATQMLRAQARLRFARGDAATAEDLTRRALVMELSHWARRRPEEAAGIEALARELTEARPPEREPPYAGAFALLRKFQGNGAFELAQWINGLSLAIAAQGRVTATEPLLREALKIRCRAWGSDCPVRRMTLVHLGGLLVAQDRRGDPLTQCRIVELRFGSWISVLDGRRGPCTSESDQSGIRRL